MSFYKIKFQTVFGLISDVDNSSFPDPSLISPKWRRRRKDLWDWERPSTRGIPRDWSSNSFTFNDKFPNAFHNSSNVKKMRVFWRISNTMAAPNYKYRLKKNHGKLLADLEPKKVVNILYQEDVFDLDEMDEVRCEKPRKRQAEVLLDKVTRSGDTNIAIFVNALRQTQKHLYELLQMPVRGEQLQAEIEAQWRANSGLCSVFL